MDSSGIKERYEKSILDLYDISLLLNYERVTTDPKFRHAKLREISKTDKFTTVSVPGGLFERDDQTIPRVSFVFDKPIKPPPNNERDLPTNMLPTNGNLNQSIENLTPKQLETYFWQTRNHDGCYQAILAFQHFIDLFPQFTRVRVRTVYKEGEINEKGEKIGRVVEKTRVYSTLASDRKIVEMELVEPKTMNASLIIPENKTYISGDDQVIKHAVLGFPSPGSSLNTVLDLASMQFGDVGRSFKGRGLFVLEPIHSFHSRLDKFAKRNTLAQANLSNRMNDNAPNNEWLKEVAARTKARWDNRGTVHWCGYCGAPPPHGRDFGKCTTCKVAFYCNAEHQKAAWTYHKHFCTPPHDSSNGC